MGEGYPRWVRLGCCDLGGEAEILSLGVLPITGGAGLVRLLLDAVCGEARLRGAECVVLEVAADNDAARALYAGRGFIVVGRRRNYYRRAGGLVDALILRAPLATAAVGNLSSLHRGFLSASCFA